MRFRTALLISLAAMLLVPMAAFTSSGSGEATELQAGDETVDGARLIAERKQKTSAKKPVVTAAAKLGEAGRVRLRGKGRVTGGRFSVTRIAQFFTGGTAELDLKFRDEAKKAVRKDLQNGLKVKVRLKAVFIDEAGNKDIKRRMVKLR